MQQVNLSSGNREKLSKALVDIEKEILASHEKSRFFQENKAIDAIKRNSKFFYSYVNKLSKVKSRIGPLLTKNKVYTSDNKEMADTLSEQFVSVFSPQKEVLQRPNVVSS